MRRISILFLLILSSCSSYKFAKQGIFTEDVDEYFNIKEHINVWTYMNFQPKENEKTGVRLKTLYPDDKEILKKLNISGRNKKVLFSAVPETGPFYNLLAIKYRKLKPENYKDFERVAYNQAYYFQKDIGLGRLDIRQIIIPYGDEEALSLIYYISTEKHLNCRYCKLTYLANINAEELQIKKQFNTDWKASLNTDSTFIRTDIAHYPKRMKKNGLVLMKIFADYGESLGIHHFKILTLKDKNTSVLLEPNTYYVEYWDTQNTLLQRDTLEVY